MMLIYFCIRVRKYFPLGMVRDGYKIKKEANVITNVALISSCEMFKTGIKGLLSEKLAACHVAWDCNSIISTESRLNKNINLLILSLPTHPLEMGDSIAILKEVRIANPRMIIVVVIESCISYLIASLKSLKVNAIISHKASLKEWFLHIAIALKGNKTYSHHVVESVRLAPDLSSLKYDELVVLSYLSQGVAINHIVNLMSKGIKTIEVKRARGMRKLGMHHYADLIAIKNILRDENL